MPFSVTEFVTSRRVVLAKDTESAILEFVGFGDSDDAVARAAFDLQIPATFTPFLNALPRLDFECWTLGGQFWRAVARYGPDGAPPYPAVGGVGPPALVPAVPGVNSPIGPEYAFDFEGVVEHITQSKETISKTKRGGGDAPDNAGAIGVTRDGQVQGCDRLRPNFTWTKTVTFGSVTHEYLKLVGEMVGKTNSVSFHHRSAGSCIFTGGNCQIDDTFKAKCTFKFLDSPNLTDIAICDGLTVPAKKGSEYLWVSYKDVKDNNRVWQQPDAAYVERITDSADFTNLRIGA